jgi:hypothetical protein
MVRGPRDLRYNGGAFLRWRRLDDGLARFNNRWYKRVMPHMLLEKPMPRLPRTSIFTVRSQRGLRHEARAKKLPQTKSQTKSQTKRLC